MEQWKIERIEAVLKGFGTQDGEYVDRPAEIRIVDEEDCFVCHIQNRKAEYITDEAEEIAELLVSAPETLRQRDALLEALKENRRRLVFLHQAIMGETKPIFNDIEIRKTGSCIIFIDEAIAEVEGK